MAMVVLASGGAERRHIPGAAAAFERVAHDDGRRRSGRDDEDEGEREKREIARVDRRPRSLPQDGGVRRRFRVIALLARFDPHLQPVRRRRQRARGPRVVGARRVLRAIEVERHLAVRSRARRCRGSARTDRWCRRWSDRGTRTTGGRPTATLPCSRSCRRSSPPRCRAP